MLYIPEAETSFRLIDVEMKHCKLIGVLPCNLIYNIETKIKIFCIFKLNRAERAVFIFICIDEFFTDQLSGISGGSDAAADFLLLLYCLRELTTAQNKQSFPPTAIIPCGVPLL